ncbi:MAG TPA: hypothetical protein VFO00_14490 [Vitreimonas sp.]|nr:hypothetical protein [Vitreimonas sp.]
MKYRAGDWVIVRSKDEILATLDRDGRLDGMPFMPEMFEYCGRRMRVHRRTHKACDTIAGMTSRRLPDSVLLESVRCSGAAHDGCEAQCSVFWRAEWLKPADTADEVSPGPSSGCTEDCVLRATSVELGGKRRYKCQATDFPRYSTPLRAREIDQYVEDYVSGNVTLKEIALTSTYFLFKFFGGAKYAVEASWRRKFYDWIQSLWGGVPYPRRPGTAQTGRELVEALNLQPGELVRVKSYEEILKTIDRDGMNRGLFFDAEMVPYCGGVFRVRARVDKFINEKTGAMIRLKTPAVILEGGWCRGRYSAYRLFCPRAIYSWWREAWLQRAPDTSEEDFASSLGAREVLKQRPNQSLV